MKGQYFIKSDMFFVLVIASVILGAKGIHELRLSDGSHWAEGRAEVRINEQWYTICSQSYTSNVHDVLCRMFGSPDCSYVYWYTLNDGNGHGPSIENLVCNGAEASIHECSFTFLPRGSNCAGTGYLHFHFNFYGYYYMYWYYWYHLHNVIRLTGGPSPYNGRLEVLFHGDWGTVCDDGFGRNEAKVVCRMLGFRNPIGFAYKRALYGKGSGNIYFDDVNCNGYESHLFHCQLQPHVEGRCLHSEDVGVFCAEELTFALCVGAAVLLVVAVITTVAVVFIVRRCRKEINCATAELDATKWDLLLVTDSRDAITNITWQIMSALSVLESKPKVKRTQVHRLHLHSTPVKCDRVIFILCNSYTSNEKCCKHLFPNLALRAVNPKTIKMFVTDLECKSFEERDVKREADRSFTVVQVDQVTIHGNWQVPFIRMYFEPRQVSACFYTATLVAEDAANIQTFSDTLKEILAAFGFQADVPGQLVSFRLVVKQKAGDATPEKRSNPNVPDFTFVRRPRKFIDTVEDPRVFTSDELLNGTLFILFKMKAIKQKYYVKKKPITEIV